MLCSSKPYKDIRLEQRLFYHLLPVAPLLLHLVQRAVVDDVLAGKGICYLLFPPGHTVDSIPF
jgi:hypothetical protein